MLAQHSVNLLQAPMGSGKTTLCNELLKQWGSDSAGSSPTFALIEEHSGPQGTLFHVDAYRIDHEEEAYDFGFEEYIESGHPMWIEWAEKVESFLPYRVGVVYIKRGERFILARLNFSRNVRGLRNTMEP